MTRTLQVLWLTLLCLTVSPAESSLAAEGSWVYFAGDPGGYGYGFARPVWASKVNKALVFFGNSHNPIGNNSIRAYDPVANSWSFLWPNEFTASLPNGRWPPSVGRPQGDNFYAFYVPTLGTAGELWVIGGSGLDNYVTRTEPPTPAWFSGVFDIAKADGTTKSGAWVSLGTTLDSAFTERIAGIGTVASFQFGADPSMDWCASQNMGIIFGGDDGQGNANNRMLIIAPNPQGPQPYRIFEKQHSQTDPWPDKRMQATNIGTCDDTHYYYVYGGYNNWGGGHLLNDLWRFDLLTYKWEQLPSGGVTGYEQMVSYDPVRRAIVVYGQHPTVSAFFLDTQQWMDVTPTGVAPQYAQGVYNSGVVYSPITNEHMYFGGNKLPLGDGAYMTAKFTLAGTGTVPLPPPSPPPGPCATSITLTWNGKATDRVGQGDGLSLPDGQPDGVFTLTFGPVTGTCIVSRLEFSRANLGKWDTITNNGDWILGIAKTLTGPLFNAANDTVNFAVTSGDIFDLFAGDYQGLLFVGGSVFTLKVSFSDGSIVTGGVGITVPPPPPPPPPPPGWLNLPLRTWVSRPYPPNDPNPVAQVIGSTGHGPSTWGTGAKHQRIVYNPDNKRLYFYSGDWNGGPPFQSSFQTAFYSYDITHSISDGAADYQNWRLEWPHCGLPGQISPVHTDEAAFTFDTTRHVFWEMGGFESSNESVKTMCGNNGAVYYGSDGWNGVGTDVRGDADFPPDLLQFDPATNRWSRPDQKYQPAGSSKMQDGQTRGVSSRHAIYNPVTDEIIQIAYDGGCNSVVERMDVKTGKWWQDGCIGTNIGYDGIDGHDMAPGTMFNHEQLALDVARQYIYVIDTWSKNSSMFRLMRYDITNHSMVNLGQIPLPMGSVKPSFANRDVFPFYMVPYDSTMLAWDSINNVLLWPASSNEGRPILMIYHPDTQMVRDLKGQQVLGKNGRWEIDPMNRDKPTEIISGSNGTFIPELNALVIYGGYGTPNDDYFAESCKTCDAPIHYFWLYRYGNGSGQRSNSSK